MAKKLNKGSSNIITVKDYGPGSVEGVWTAKFLYKEIFKTKKTYLIPSFIYALCSIIEENLNCLLIDFFYSKFGNTYKIHVNIYLKMSIHEKLRVIIPLISQYRYDFNFEKNELKSIKRLFDSRNQLIHIKNHYYSVLYEIYDTGKEYITTLNEKELNIYSNASFEKLNKTILLEFYQAQKKLTPFLSRLHERIQKRNFKPKDWIISVTIKS